MEALRADLEEAQRIASAASHRGDTEAESAARQQAAAEELTFELLRLKVRLQVSMVVGLRIYC